MGSRIKKRGVQAYPEDVAMEGNKCASLARKRCGFKFSTYFASLSCLFISLVKMSRFR